MPLTRTDVSLRMSQPATPASVFVAIATLNCDALVEFYSQLFEIHPHAYSPGVYAEFQMPGMKLSIFKPKSAHESEFHGSTSGSMSVCMQVSSLDGAITKLRAMGCSPIRAPWASSHGRETYIYDPDGNRIILYQPNAPI